MQANLFTGSFSSPAHQVVEMAALASCIGARAMFRPIPSSKPTVQLPSGNGTASLMSRHDLVNLFARKTPLAKQRPPQAAASAAADTLVKEAEKTATKFDDLFDKLVPDPGAELQTLQSSFVIQRAADLSDDIDEKAGRHVTIQIVSTPDNPNSKKPLVSDEVAILNWCRTLDMLDSTKFVFNLDFQVPKSFGKPVALIVRNHHKNEFLLESFTLTLPDSSAINFPTRTWIYKASDPEWDHPGRIIFSNELYLPSKTPVGLVKLRQKELENLRGDRTGERNYNDRIYDYDVYNDLGDPDLSKSLRRQVLGGSTEFPYPRRCRTGRRRCQTDPDSESKDPLFYIPRDERFKLPIPGKDFGSFDDIRTLYAKTANAPPKFPCPDVIAEDKNAWSTDVEFAREMLAGLNPLVIQRLEKFPIQSNLQDPKVYGDPQSLITKEILEEGIKDIEGEPITVDEALKQKKLFVLDYYDIFLPYVNKINELDGRAMYAPRTVLFLTKENILLPLAIELALPPSTRGGKKNSRVFTPKQQRDGVWPLAKAHVASVDTSVHEVISHFLRTHAVIEPFVIATNRHLSVLHPIHKVLSPHFKKTMEINQGARQDLIQAGGIIEGNFIPGKYAMELGSVVYKDWKFNEQSLPKDLIKRGMAEEDSESPHGIKLVIEDYPYAADGLELWAALKEYMTHHIKIFYDNDKVVEEDTELQSWWDEVKTKGHGDKKDGWPTLNSIEDLADTLTTIAWVASCNHAAVNFGQYTYGGFMPNRPSMTRKLIPEEGTDEYKDLSDPKKREKAFLAMVSNQSQANKVMGTLQLLSAHSPDEEYLGQRVTPNWSNDPEVLDAFNKFAEKIKDVEQLINTRNANKSLKNRTGPVQVPYELLHPSSPPGVTGKGVPYSISV